jgi:hypothetical protein
MSDMRQMLFTFWGLLGLAIYDARTLTDNFFLGVALTVPIGCWLAFVAERLPKKSAHSLEGRAIR